MTIHWYHDQPVYVCSNKDRIERCLEDKLKSYTSKAASKNAFIYHTPAVEDQEEKYFLPYIGNI